MIRVTTPTPANNAVNAAQVALNTAPAHLNAPHHNVMYTHDASGLDTRIPADSS